MNRRTRCPGIDPPHFRAFRLRSSLPVVAEFFAVQFVLDVYDPPHTASREVLVVHLPWQPKQHGRELDHAGAGVLRRALTTRYEIRCPSLAEVVLLRLARQGDAEELAGLFCKLSD